eukprot:scaffold299366_cov17-Prasinocladus_malaysianus.AAC.1
MLNSCQALQAEVWAVNSESWVGKVIQGVAGALGLRKRQSCVPDRMEELAVCSSGLLSTTWKTGRNMAERQDRQAAVSESHMPARQGKIYLLELYAFGK